METFESKGLLKKKFMSSHDSSDHFRIRDRVDPSSNTNDADLSVTNNSLKGDGVNLNSSNESTSLNESSMGRVLSRV